MNVMLVAQNKPLCYSSIENWYGDMFGGEVTVRLEILANDKDTMEIVLQKVITPFSPIIDVRTQAKLS